MSLEYREEFEIAAYIFTVITSLLLLLVLGLLEDQQSDTDLRGKPLAASVTT